MEKRPRFFLTGPLYTWSLIPNARLPRLSTSSGVVSPAAVRPVGTGFTGFTAPDINNVNHVFHAGFGARVPYGRSWYK